MLVMQEGDSLFGGLPIIDITYQQYIANPSAYHDPGVIVHITGYPTAGNMPADYVGYNNDLNMEDIGNIATKAIAKVEPSDTALYLHPVCSYFINKDGNACVTDVQISVGGAITLGTNCHVVDGVANDINSNLTVKNRSADVTLSTHGSTRVLLQVGNIFYLNVTATTGANDFELIAQIPSSIAPFANTPCSCYVATSSDVGKVTDAVLTNTGDVFVRTTSALTGDVNISVCWIIG